MRSPNPIAPEPRDCWSVQVTLGALSFNLCVACHLAYSPIQAGHPSRLVFAAALSANTFPAAKTTSRRMTRARIVLKTDTRRLVHDYIGISRSPTDLPLSIYICRERHSDTLLVRVHMAFSQQDFRCEHLRIF